MRTSTRSPEAARDARVSPAPRRRRRRLWVVLAAFLGLLALVAVLAWTALGSRLLVIQKIQVTGTHRLTRGEVTEAAGVPLGSPLARVDTDAVRRRVAALREVESVEVRRVWPTTLRIAVTERVPLAVTRTGTGYAVLDRFGVAIATVPRRPLRLPVLDVAGPRRDDPATLAALAVLSALPRRIAVEVRSVSAAEPDRVVLHLRGGATVVWGDPGRSRQKARVLAALLRHGARTYDVSSPDVVTTR